jgi:hypothetical protein
MTNESELSALYAICARSDQDYSYIGWIYFLDPPIIEVVVQIAIAYLELELLEEFFILVNIKCIKHVISFLLGYDECIGHQICNVNNIGHEIIRVSHVENLVRCVA